MISPQQLKPLSRRFKLALCVQACLLIGSASAKKCGLRSWVHSPDLVRQTVISASLHHRDIKYSGRIFHPSSWDLDAVFRAHNGWRHRWAVCTPIYLYDILWRYNIICKWKLKCYFLSPWNCSISRFFFSILPSAHSSSLFSSSVLILVTSLILLSFFPSHILISSHVHRASPGAQEVVCSSGWGRISPPPPPLGDRWLGLLSAEVLHSAGQGAAQRRLENTHSWHPAQCNLLDRWQVCTYFKAQNSNWNNNKKKRNIYQKVKSCLQHVLNQELI